MATPQFLISRVRILAELEEAPHIYKFSDQSVLAINVSIKAGLMFFNISAF